MESYNNPIQVMVDEHRIISSADQTIKQLDQYWKISEVEFEKHVRSLLSFFREYSDKFHHFKEEQVLFQELEEHADFAIPALISELKEHHEIFREHTQTIKMFLDSKQFDKAYAILVTYMNELLDHISVENDELFVMAESLLSYSELETIYYKFKDIDILLGESKKAELVEMLENIQKEISQTNIIG